MTRYELIGGALDGCQVDHEKLYPTLTFPHALRKVALIAPLCGEPGTNRDLDRLAQHAGDYVLKVVAGDAFYEAAE